MEILKNIKKNTMIIILVTIIVMYFVLKDDFPLIIENLKHLDLKYVFFAIVCFFMYIVLHSYIVYKTVDKKDKFSFLESIKHKLIVQFFNGITPFSTGGQPMEIYMLSKHGISGAKASNYILQNFVFYQIALVLFGLFAIIYNYQNHLFPQVKVLRQLVILGFIINTLVALLLLFISLSKKMTLKFLVAILKFLNKIHLVKDLEKEQTKWNRRVSEFHECASELKKNKGLFLLGVIFNFVGLMFLYIIPLFITYALGDFTSLNVEKTITSSAYVMIGASFVPIPGASGGIEYFYTQFFGNFLVNSKNSVTLLIWRFITYYLGMIVGAVLFNFDKEKIKGD